MKIVMLGAPGAGKGTQALRIAEQYGVPHISSGDIFRKNLKEGTELGLRAKAYMDEGLLVPDELTTDLVISRLREEDCKDGYVLDGFPRTLPQARALSEKLKSEGARIDFALDIEVSDEEIVSRVSGRRICPKCGAGFHTLYNKPQIDGICDICGAELKMRDDDRPETVLKRLEVYHAETEPLIAYYKEEGILRTVDGSQSIDKVFEDSLNVLQD
ncbi:MAG: adenylate kinase [Lachnospiraceae bacterium]|nr:adenylate kinase [Lachnospiraceae bacterium]